MKIAFLCYWGIEDGLTAATVVPHLYILDKIPQVERIFLFTIERNGKPRSVTLPGKVDHEMLISSNRYFNKVSDFTTFPVRIGNFVKKLDVNLIICRGTPAGALGYLVHRQTGVPYVVESFEPHAAYMLESGVWRQRGLRYNVQRFLEGRQERTARYLLPAAPEMQLELVRRGIPPAKIRVMPCAADTTRFRFDIEKRNAVRLALGMSFDSVCGIYVGKFGGLYYDEDAFDVFREALNYFPKFKLLILSPDSPDEIKLKLSNTGFAVGDYSVMKVSHEEVPAYLSAADFAFALYKPSPSKRFLSPVKIGEYWASGLPVMISPGIGDASTTIEAYEAGAVFHLSAVGAAFSRIQSLLMDDRPSLRKRIRDLAVSLRNYETNRKIYCEIVAEVSKGTDS